MEHIKKKFVLGPCHRCQKPSDDHYKNANKCVVSHSFLSSEFFPIRGMLEGALYWSEMTNSLLIYYLFVTPANRSCRIGA